MSNLEIEDGTKPEVCDDALKNQTEGENTVEGGKCPDTTKETTMPSSQQEQVCAVAFAELNSLENSFPNKEEVIKKKYGGLLRKKHPLISKDHEHAFFDSADWALGKQGAQKAKGPLEALQPKLQPTPHQQVPARRSAYAPADETKEVEDGKNECAGDQCCPTDEHKDANTKEQ